jgi:integral membrane protein
MLGYKYLIYFKINQILIHPCGNIKYTQGFILIDLSMTMNIQTLRIVGLLEGISFLLLLFIAMPMKYMLDNPILVKYVGMGHGVLFILFLIVLFTVCEKQKWSIYMFILGLIASILPFGTFVFDRKLKNFEQPIAESEV